MTPKLKLSIIFWTITIPLLPIVIPLLLIGLVMSPIPTVGDKMLNKIESVIIKFTIWRNNLPIVKNAYDKAHLFDYIKN